MKVIPELQAERQRLLNRLDDQTLAIKQEIEGIKNQLQPLELLETAIEQVTESVQDSQLTAQLTKLAISALPIQWSKHPAVATGVRLAMPWMLEKLSDVKDALGQVISWDGVQETLMDTVAGVQRAFKQT
ncbi:hypothetical protein [Haliscomenobacter sp.]|uniref:hypothetical protein n=1 Tax=Haliscomenobacter sp. TaxID=2717303 RepID=UPI003BACDBBE